MNILTRQAMCVQHNNCCHGNAIIRSLCKLVNLNVAAKNVKVFIVAKNIRYSGFPLHCCRVTKFFFFFCCPQHKSELLSLRVKWPIFCPILIKNWSFSTDFVEVPHITDHENPSSGCRAVASGWTRVWQSWQQLFATYARVFRRSRLNYFTVKFCRHVKLGPLL